jgi:hypothetical protein
MYKNLKFEDLAATALLLLNEKKNSDSAVKRRSIWVLPCQ